MRPSMKMFHLAVVFLTFVINVFPLPEHAFRGNALETTKDIQDNEHFDLGLHLEEEWASFKNKYGKISYDSLEDEAFRKSIFEKNLRTIRTHNLLFSRNLSSYEMAVNQFSDWTFEEYQELNGYKRPKHSLSTKTYLGTLDVEVPEEIDWRTKGYVTEVKNQLRCGSCWAFSATGAIEGQHFRKTGKLVPLSEQNLVDCTSSYGNAGCKGGWMNNAFLYVIENGGIDTEESYPYKAVEQDCQFANDGVGATVEDYVDIEEGNERKLMEVVAEEGPISVAIDASHNSFKQYSKGMYDEPKCSTEKLTHAVLVVGYGKENGKEYWLVKNSWGTAWGDSGYIKMVRNKGNQCGIASKASFPIV